MYIGNKKIKSVYLGSNIIKSIYLGAKVIWKRAVDTAIALLISSKAASGTIWPYAVNATIYTGIDLSLYKGVQFYVAAANVGCNFSNVTNSLRVCAYDESDNTNLGYVTIASAYNSGTTVTKTSKKGKTLELDFSASSGTACLKVVGISNGTADAASWSLTNVILLAR